MWKNRKKTIGSDEDDFLTVSEVLKNNEAEKKKKTKKPKKTETEKKDGIKTGKFLVGCIVIGLVFAFFVIDSGPIGQYKRNVQTNINGIVDSLGLSGIFKQSDFEELDVHIAEQPVVSGLESTLSQDSKMLPFENASLSRIALGAGGLVVAKSNYLAIFDRDGKAIWETQTSVIEPILRTEGEYILLAEKGANKICLYQNQTLLFSVDSPNPILTAQLSANGDTALVTKKEFYKNAVLVYNKNGEQIFSWNSGTDTIINADISASTRRIAVSLLNTDERVKSYVMLFDINKTEAYHNVEFLESVVYKTHFIGETLNLCADNRITGLKVSGDVLWDELYNNSELILSSSDKDGNKAVVIEKNNLPELITYSKKGTEKERIKLDVLPDYLDIKANKLLYNNERIVVFGGIDKPDRFIASMDIKGLYITDESSFVIVYNNSLEFVSSK